MSQFTNTVAQNTWPTCLVLPAKNGSTTNCIQIKMPSMPTIILILIISWIILMAVAYAMYYFLKKYEPNTKYNYWLILLILVLSGIIVSLLSKLFN